MVNGMALCSAETQKKGFVNSRRGKLRDVLTVVEGKMPVAVLETESAKRSPLDRNRAGDLSVSINSFTAERDSQLHHKGI